jgi:hypothetical protein
MAATAWVMLFGVQMIFAVAADFVPVTGVGRVLYPLYLGRDPWTPANLVINLTLLLTALGAFYFADKLDRDAFFQEHTRWRAPRDGSVHFSQ